MLAVYAPKKGKGRIRPRNILITAVAFVLALTALWIGMRRSDTSHKRLGENEVQFHFIDVGQGDAALIRAPEGTILIDTGTGESEERLAAYLQELRIQTIDYLVLTHPDEDHIGGADMILERFDVRAVVLPRVEASTQTYEFMMSAIRAKECTILWASPHTILSIGELTCTILAPLREDYKEINQHSVVLRVDYGETSALFTGDAEIAVEKELVDRYGTLAGGLLDCDLIKIGHHGSSTSSGSDFLEAVSPAFGVISCGAGNPHGHPTPSVLAAYAARDTVVYRTDIHGSVVFTSTGGEPVNPAA